MVEISPSNAGGVGSIPGQGARIPHASWPKNEGIKQKQYITNSIKTLKMPHIKKKSLKKYDENRARLFCLRQPNTGAYLGSLVWLMTDSGRAHAKEYFPELLLPVSLSP